MRKISEKELKEKGIKLKANDLGRMAASKSAKVLYDASNVIKDTVKTLEVISTAATKNMTVNTDIIKLLGKGKDKDLVQKVEIVGGDKSSKQWRVRITGRDRDGLISEMIMEQI